MEMSADIGAISKALAAAQAELDGSFVATHTAKIPGKEGKQGYEYKYGDLSDALRATRALNRVGIAVIQPTSTTERGVKVITQLSHESGQWMRSEPLIMPVGVNNAQAVGSAITYARRYQLLGMVGLAPEDDDGQEARDNPPPPSRPAKPRQSKPKADTAEQDLDDGLGPRCTGKAAGIAKGIGERMRTLVALRKAKASEVWADVLAEAGVDVSKYGPKIPHSEALTVEDGTLVRAYLVRMLDGTQAEQPPLDPAGMAKLRAETQAVWNKLCAEDPDNYAQGAWKAEWASAANLDGEWPDQPTEQQYRAAIAGLTETLRSL